MFLHASSICAVLLSLFWPWGAAQGVLSGGCFEAQTSLPDTLVVKSPALHCADSVLVYSPFSASAARDLPTVILLHGWSGSPRNWAANMDIQGLSDEFGFRIICPDGFKDSWYMNKTDSTSMRWRDFFWDELWPMIDSRYGLKADRVFTDGLSMGGHGAMNLFLDHPELMRGAGSMSGVLNLRNSGGSRVLIPPMLGVERIEDPVCDAQSAVNRIGRVVEICGAGAASKLLIVSCGLQDKTFLPASHEFEAKAAEQGLRVIAQYTPGKHRWPFWCWALRCHLEWFRAELSR